MTELSDAGAWLVSGLLVLGAGFAFIGSLGLLRLDSFYKRVHAPTLGSTVGTALICLASFAHASFQRGGASGHEILILAFVTITTPVGLILLVRAALFRDRAESRKPGQPDRPL